MPRPNPESDPYGYLEWSVAKNNAWSAQQAQTQMDFQREMSNTAHQRQIADLKAAGLNPVLSAKLGGASTPSGAMGSTDTSGSAIIDLANKSLDVANSAVGGSRYTSNSSFQLPTFRNPRDWKQLFYNGIASIANELGLPGKVVDFGKGLFTGSAKNSSSVSLPATPQDAVDRMRDFYTGIEEDAKRYAASKGEDKPSDFESWRDSTKEGFVSDLLNGIGGTFLGNGNNYSAAGAAAGAGAAAAFNPIGMLLPLLIGNAGSWKKQTK